ncbi:MAG: hypothetical protein P8P27_00225 [Flavobacteriaceae bacterium]|jgi:hypothetical protein|nr:hypothetical protein [Flavobacteriaceae bacterium]
MKEQKSDEIDLTNLFNVFKEKIKASIVLLFDLIDYLIKKWILITALIVLGLIIGYVNQNNYNHNKKASVLLRINFDTVDYVYSEIDLINEKVTEKDSLFFSEMGLKGDSIQIKEIEITPIVRFKEIIERYKENDRKLEGLLKSLEFNDDDVESYETFKSEYYFHTLNFTLSYNATQETIEKTIEYLNNNIILTDIKNSSIRDIKSQIANNSTSIKQIDNVINAYKTNESLTSPSDQIFVVDKNFNMSEMFEKKIELQELNAELNKILVYSKDIVVVVNKPKIIEENTKFSSNRIVFFPSLFVFIFLLFSFLKYTYIYLKEIANSRK